MKREGTRHIGDDQLVHGLPKHMVAVATNEPPQRGRRRDPRGDHYWTVHPKPGACPRCQDMAGKEYSIEPERPHPSCKCEIKKHPLRRQKKYINGAITGHEYLDLVGGYHVKIDFHGKSGGLTSGIHLVSNQGHSMQIACPPLTSNSVVLAARDQPPVPWMIHMVAAGSDNVLIYYTVTFDDWSE